MAVKATCEISHLRLPAAAGNPQFARQFDPHPSASCGVIVGEYPATVAADGRATMARPSPARPTPPPPTAPTCASTASGPSSPVKEDQKVHRRHSGSAGGREGC